MYDFNNRLSTIFSALEHWFLDGDFPLTTAEGAAMLGNQLASSINTYNGGSEEWI
ncbi:uncharacterized protein METZ01_LOCUS504221 [marine metagenome]|uniref:Uncharacterized protein n=1 Tax=marine metagenome TaxID=408172 RepID=A0A383E3F8_9ZZZZ